MIRDLAAAIIRDGKVPSDWEQNFIFCFYKGRGGALDLYLRWAYMAEEIYFIFYVLVIPWFVRMYDAIMHERERVHYRTYMRRTMV